MTSKVWPKALTVAATTALSGPALADNPAYQVRADWLDPHVSMDGEAQRLIITEAAQGYPIVDDRFDQYGMTTEAAHALKIARNTGELPGAEPGQTAAEWWQQAEPQLADIRREWAAEAAARPNWAGWATLGTLAVVGTIAAFSTQTSPRGPGGPPRGGGLPRLAFDNPNPPARTRSTDISAAPPAQQRRIGGP
ncbi:MAG: hypothetical protein AAF556_06030 [Pseudomonadota bacterium]